MPPAIEGTKENDAKRVSVVINHNYICIKAIFTSKAQDFKTSPEKKGIFTSSRSIKQENGSTKAGFQLISTIAVIVMIATRKLSNPYGYLLLYDRFDCGDLRLRTLTD